MAAEAAISIDPWFVSFLVALGIGLLVGTERERRKGEGPQRAAAGLRTFAIASLSGLTAMTAGGVPLLAVAALAATGLMALSYWTDRELDPGLTTEIALVTTVLLGGLALEQPTFAASGGVAITILLAARSYLHRFVSTVLTESEMRDGLILAAASFIVLPLLPDGPIDPFGAVNARSVWTIAVLVMTISAAGYVMVRAFGPSFGLPATGFASGFISSTATIGAMGQRARALPRLLGPATVGAILSTVATVVQMVLVLAATSLATLAEMGPALALGGVAAVLYALGFGLRRRDGEADGPAAVQSGRAFSPRAAIVFATVLAVVLLLTAIVGDRYGAAGVAIAAALAGFADTHSPAIAVASLVASGELAPSDAVLPILLAFTTNTVSKTVFAFVAGGPGFALRIVPGLILVAAGVWAGGLLL